MKLTLLPLLLAAFALGLLPAKAQDSAALAFLSQGRMGDASAALARSPQDASTQLLACRVSYAQELFSQAVDQCQSAADAMPRNSQAQMWLGRALGQKASHAGITAFTLARRARLAFEAAVQLDPGNRDATSDLGEFYVAAPSLLGGGYDKAVAYAGSIAQRFPALSHRILALAAEKKGDLGRAEAEFKAEVAADHSADSLVDLATFLGVHGRADDAVAVIRQALAADLSHGPADFAAAQVLYDINREPRLAEQALVAYLQSSQLSDAAPSFKAHMLLGKLLARTGDQAGAHAQFAIATGLAPQYVPAQKAAGAS